MSGSNGDSALPSFRLAPTPSGLLHHGNAASFLLTWLLARFAGGTILLRIDDLDRERFRLEYLEDVFRTIDWLGIGYDRGPSGPDDFMQHWSQTLRLDSYARLLAELQRSSRLYECDCNRSKLSNGFPCTCFERKIPDSNANSLRFNTSGHEPIVFNDLFQGMITCDIHQMIDYFVVRKKDQSPSYQIASLSDDQHFGITHLVRGEDLIPSTAAQLALDAQLTSTDFSKTQFIHHPLIKGLNGQKLSKSAGDSLPKGFKRDKNELPQIINLVGEWLGLPKHLGRLDELREASQGTCRLILNKEFHHTTFN